MKCGRLNQVEQTVGFKNMCFYIFLHCPSLPVTIIPISAMFSIWDVLGSWEFLRDAKNCQSHGLILRWAWVETTSTFVDKDCKFPVTAVRP